MQDDDEGIDVRTEGCTSSTSCASGASSGDQNRKNRRQGQYNYELFSIMIHSGSASGGHYYAYIKDFLTREWYDLRHNFILHYPRLNPYVAN